MTRVDIVCERCGSTFQVRPYRASWARFCSGSCRSSWVATRYLNKGPKPWAAANLEGKRGIGKRFPPGHTPWNAGLSLPAHPNAVATQFVPGQPSRNAAPLGAERIRRDRFGVRRAYVKTREGWRPRAVVVWEAAHGRPIPPGHLIHHVNVDPLDDRPDNLQCLTRAEHVRVHRELLGQAKARIREATP